MIYLLRDCRFLKRHFFEWRVHVRKVSADFFIRLTDRNAAGSEAPGITACETIPERGALVAWVKPQARRQKYVRHCMRFDFSGKRSHRFALPPSLLRPINSAVLSASGWLASGICTLICQRAPSATVFVHWRMRRRSSDSSCMRRKGELSAVAIDRGWLYQVMLARLCRTTAT